MHNTVSFQYAAAFIASYGNGVERIKYILLWCRECVFLCGVLRLLSTALGIRCVGKLFRYNESKGALLVGNKPVDR